MRIVSPKEFDFIEFFEIESQRADLDPVPR